MVGIYVNAQMKKIKGIRCTLPNVIDGYHHRFLLSFVLPITKMTNTQVHLKNHSRKLMGTFSQALEMLSTCNPH